MYFTYFNRKKDSIRFTLYYPIVYCGANVMCSAVKCQALYSAMLCTVQYGGMYSTVQCYVQYTVQCSVWYDLYDTQPGCLFFPIITVTVGAAFH